jgi:hypothetical protein
METTNKKIGIKATIIAKSGIEFDTPNDQPIGNKFTLNGIYYGTDELGGTTLNEGQIYFQIEANS